MVSTEYVEVTPSERGWFVTYDEIQWEFISYRDAVFAAGALARRLGHESFRTEAGNIAGKRII